MKPEHMLTKAMHEHAETIHQPLDAARLNSRLQRADSAAQLRRASVVGGLVAVVLLGGVAVGLGQPGSTEVTTAHESDYHTYTTQHPPKTDTTDTNHTYPYPTTTAPQPGPGGDPSTGATTTTHYPYPYPYPYPTTTKPSTTSTYPPYSTSTYPPSTYTTTTTGSGGSCTASAINTYSTNSTYAVGYWQGTADPGATIEGYSPGGWGSASTTADSTGKWTLRMQFSTAMPKNTPETVYVGCVEAQKKFTFSFTWYDTTATTSTSTTSTTSTTMPTTTTTVPGPTVCTMQQINATASGPNPRGYYKGTAAPGSHVTSWVDGGWASAYVTVDSAGNWVFGMDFSPSTPINTPLTVHVGCVENGHNQTFSFTWYG